MMKFTVTAFLILLCTAALLSTTEARHNHRPRLRCKCIKTDLKTPNLTKNIVSLKVIPAGPHCKHMEIIAKMKKGETCLNPNLDWVVSLIKEMSNKNVTNSTQRI